jgi:outer membrane receptor protein involved in Fe transport
MNPLSRKRGKSAPKASAVKTLFAVLAFALPAAKAWSAEAAAGDSLDELVVNATRSDTRLQDMPLHTTIITHEEIENSPATSVDQLLRQVPGLLIPGSPFYTTDPTGNNITFRGLSKKVLVLVDGVPLLDPFYTTIQWFRVPLSNIERVEIVRGGGSGLWGNLAVGGVINIVTKRPTENSGDVALTGGSLGTYSAALNKNQVINDYLSLNLSADTFQTDGYNNAPQALRAAFWPGRGDSSATFQNVRLGAYFQPTADLSGFLRAGYHVQKEDIGGYAFGANNQRSPDFQGGLTEIFNAASRLTASIYGQNVNFTKFNGAGCYVASVYACGASVSGAGASAAQQMGQVLQYASSFDANPYRERGGSLIYSHSYQGLFTDAEYGFDYRRISGEDSQQVYRTPTNALPEVLRIQRTNFGAGNQAFLAVFAQTKLNPIDRLEITLSAREDRYESRDGTAIQTNYSNAIAPVPGTPLGGAVPSGNTTRFDPSLSVRYAATQNLSFRGSIYEAFRAPGLNNLYRSFGTSSITIANPLLGPETLLGKELGFDWHDNSFTLGATVFQEYVKNMVATYQINPGAVIPAAVQAICGADYSGVPNTFCPGTVSFNTNGQDERSNGVELDAKWTITPSLNVAAYATATQAYYTRATTGDPVDRQLPLVPRYVGGGNLTWNALDRWTQLLDIRYVSAMTLSSLTSVPLVRQGGYAVTDLSSTYRFGHGLTVSAAVQNLFDKTYTDSSASNPQSISEALPRTISVTLRQSF